MSCICRKFEVSFCYSFNVTGFGFCNACFFAGVGNLEEEKWEEKKRRFLTHAWFDSFCLAIVNWPLESMYHEHGDSSLPFNWRNPFAIIKITMEVTTIWIFFNHWLEPTVYSAAPAAFVFLFRFEKNSNVVHNTNYYC